MPPRFLLTPLLCLLLAACGNDEAAARKATSGADELPAPDTVSGSVTGMPNPGQATVVPAEVPPPVDEAAMADPVDPLAMPPEADPIAIEPGPAAPEPGPDAAVAVLRDYFAAVNAREFARAQAAWRGNGQALAQEFADVAGISVEIGPPGPVDAGAGQRYVEVPVRLDITRADGRLERQSGRYLLQRSVVEGGDPDWKISRSSFGGR